MKDLLPWLYGQALVGVLTASFAWVPLLWRRLRGIARQAISRDAYLWVALGIVAILLGVLAGTSTRLTTLILTGDDMAGRFPAGVIASLALLSVGSAALVWGSTIDRKPTAWRWFAVLSALWLAFELIWRS
jgi:uncharacterized membrane protein